MDRDPMRTFDPRKLDYRTWGLPIAVVLLLPVVFVLLRLWLPPIGPHKLVPASVPAPVPAQPTEQQAPQQPGGTATCMGCHAEQYDAWSSSSHARAEGPLTDALPFQEAGARQGDPTLAAVRTIGVAPVVQFLLPRPGGRLQVTSMAYDPGKSEWFDVFGEVRQEGEWGHWTGGGMTWNTQCAGCHSTRVTKGWSEETQSFATTALENDVGCAACHSESATHTTPSPSTLATDPKPNLDTCASCHSRRADLTGKFAPTERFVDHFAPQLVDATETFWPDGQVREEDFEWTSFVGSVMHSRGVTCTSCHDPHSGALEAQGDALCLGCHSSLPGFQPHDKHKDSTSASCVGCHMPITTYMQRDPRHDHGFGVPDPWLAVQEGIPDACTRCHSALPSSAAKGLDRTASGSLAAATRWWGDLSSPRRTRALALAAGRRGEESAIPGLLLLLREERIAAWRSAAAGTLEPFVERQEVQQALFAALQDEDALVRFAAVGALGAAAPLPSVSQAIDPLLADPVRAVRVGAARALRGRLSPNDSRAADYVAYLALASDTPTALLERGSWAIERGDSAMAVKDLARAVEMDGHSPPLRDAYAIALAGYGRPADAALQLRQAVALAPDDAALWFRLGLGLAGTGDLQGAQDALSKSTGLDASDARVWYNLGLVRQQLGQGEPAIDALKKAAGLSPDADSRYALASTLFSQGRVQEAHTEALAVLALAPAHPGALQIRDQTPSPR